jgi:hypothetical protein
LCLRALLNHADFPGRDELTVQAESATVIGYCPCPCATVALHVSRKAPRAVGTKSPIPNEATVLDADGEAIGVILAFADNGYLSALEIYDWTDPEGISPLPPLERLELRVER